MKKMNLYFVLLGLTLAVWFCAPFIIYGILNSGNIIGITGSVMIFLYGVFYKTINILFVNAWHNIVGKIFLSAIAAAFIFVLSVVIVITFNIIKSARRDVVENSTVVVLGCRVRENGPSLMLSERIEAAFEYLTENPKTTCILSGGKGEDEPVSEAECMYNSLTALGIDKSRLIIEDKSTSTEENILFSSKIIEELSLSKKITVITNDFHEFRANVFAKDLGIESYSFSARTNLIFLPTYYVREVCGIIYHYLDL